MACCTRRSGMYSISRIDPRTLRARRLKPAPGIHAGRYFTTPTHATTFSTRQQAGEQGREGGGLTDGEKVDEERSRAARMEYRMDSAVNVPNERVVKRLHRDAIPDAHDDRHRIPARARPHQQRRTPTKIQIHRNTHTHFLTWSMKSWGERRRSARSLCAWAVWVGLYPSTTALLSKAARYQRRWWRHWSLYCISTRLRHSMLHSNRRQPSRREGEERERGRTSRCGT